MIKGVEIERVVITLLALTNPPINWVLMGVILQHYRSQHQGTRYSCKHPGYGKTFTQIGSVRKHERHIHQASKTIPCECPVCGKKFMAKASIKEHYRQRRQGYYPCKHPECTSLFTTPVDMEEHNRMKHIDLEPP
jgi:uncharacterized Zn-finger protein